jgi:hypothetical protein
MKPRFCQCCGGSFRGREFFCEICWPLAERTHTSGLAPLSHAQRWGYRPIQNARGEIQPIAPAQGLRR